MDSFILCLELIYFGVGLLTGILLCLLLEGKKKQKLLIDENRKLNIEKEKIQVFFNDFDKNQRKVSRIKHDFNNNLQIVYNLLDNGEIQKASKFLEEILDNISEQ
ncbi:MAG: Spo0B domain-containing protein [Lachnospiraceae bacterium]|nr:Spo0B domain-containing protein [Lachnospiraceae bacterium]